jgi:hypothetical protein
LSPDSNGVCGVRCGHVFFAGACVAAAAASAFRFPSPVETFLGDDRWILLVNGRWPLTLSPRHSKKRRTCLFFPLADISGITNILPVFSPYWLSPITSFHHIGDNRYYRDILESVTSLNCAPVSAGAFSDAVFCCWNKRL